MSTDEAAIEKARQHFEFFARWLERTKPVGRFGLLRIAVRDGLLLLSELDEQRRDPLRHIKAIEDPDFVMPDWSADV